MSWVSQGRCGEGAGRRLPVFPLVPAVSKRSSETLDISEAAMIRLNKYLSHCSLKKNELSVYCLDMVMAHQYYNTVCLTIHVRQYDLWS